MTTGWIAVNIGLAVLLTVVVAGIAVLVPLRLDRGADAPVRSRRAAPIRLRGAPAPADRRDRARAA